MSGAILELKSAMMRQDGTKKDLMSFKVAKSSICKKYGLHMGKPYFLSVGGSRDEHKMLKTALKRHLKGFKTQEIRGSKTGPEMFKFLGKFWGRFGAQNGAQID